MLKIQSDAKTFLLNGKYESDKFVSFFSCLYASLVYGIKYDENYTISDCKINFIDFFILHKWI